MVGITSSELWHDSLATSVAQETQLCACFHSLNSVGCGGHGVGPLPAPSQYCKNLPLNFNAHFDDVKVTW